MLPDETVLTGKGHQRIHSQFNLWGKLGNTDPRFVKLLNRLIELRGPGRYLSKDFKTEAVEAHQMLETAKPMFDTVRNSAPSRVAIGDEFKNR